MENDPSPPADGLWREQPSSAREIHVDGSYFEWIEQTIDPTFAEIRNRIESLWLLIPPSHRPEFTARLRSKRYTDMFSAYCELWYSRALETNGLKCTLGTNTPKGSLPDLLLSTNAKPVACGECYLRTQPEKEIRDDFMQRRWFDATLRKLTDKRVRLWIHEMQAGTGVPDPKRFSKWLDQLAIQSPMVDDLGPYHRHGRFDYDDGESGWRIEFTLMMRVAGESVGVPQLMYMQAVSAFTACKGAELFEAAITRKARQHEGAALPTMLCIAWNYFEHEPDLREVVQVISQRSESLMRHGVYGVFWSREVYPWNPSPAAPCLLHWGSPQTSDLLTAWTGRVLDVRDMANI